MLPSGVVLAAAAALFAPATAQAGSLSATLALTSAGTSASDHSIGIASNGDKTAVWKQNQGPWANPTGEDVRAMRIVVRRVRVVKGGKVTYREDFSARPLVIHSQKDRFVSEVVSATNPSGTTTVVWGLRDTTGNKVRLLLRRIDPAGRLGRTVEIAPAGTRATDLDVESAANGMTTVLWRTDDTVQSWLMLRRIDSRGGLGSAFQLTPGKGAYFAPSLATRADGSVAAVWRLDGGANPVVQAIHVDSRGRKGVPVNIGNPARFNNDDPDVTMGPGGIAAVAWSERLEGDDGEGVVLMRRIDSQGKVGRAVELSRLGGPYKPAIGVASNGTASIAWDYWDPATSSIRIRMTRVTSRYAKSSVLDLGPAGESLVFGYGPELVVSPAGTTTLTWSVVQGGFPAPVYLQAVRVDGRGAISRVRLVQPYAPSPDLVHLPVIAGSQGGSALVGFLKRNFGGSEAQLRLIAWN